MARTNTIEDFWTRVDKIPDGCWIWTGQKNQWGYGRFRIGAPRKVVHRIAYEALVGPIPEGLTLDHLCRNTSCVNPAHLEPVTMRENILRGNAMGAIHARKTHCIHGHPFDAENTHMRPAGRECRECRRSVYPSSARKAS